MSGERPAVKAKPRMERNRVLVTGGAGFVGSHLCDFLVGRGDHVICMGASSRAWGCFADREALRAHWSASRSSKHPINSCITTGRCPK